MSHTIVGTTTFPLNHK